MSDARVEDLERTLGDKLRRFFQRRFGNAADAADATQETYVRLLRADPALALDNPAAYVFRVARNLALDHERQRRFRSRFEAINVDQAVLANVADDAASPEQHAIDRDRVRVFERALATLPPRARMVFILSRLEDCSYAEIADTLGVSVNTVYGDIRLAMAHCFDAMARR